MNRRIVSAALILFAAFIGLGSSAAISRLVGDRSIRATTDAKGAVVEIDGNRIVEVISDSENAVTVLVYRHGAQVMSLSFLNDDPEPYRTYRTIRDSKGSTVVIYKSDGGVESSTFIPFEQ